ncbi:hypothetical protein BZA05DRAFT_407508 [Tricharina praecox]|uniref:uncharacterized protein n=1 Tax=Tricharina praecox TaxID=43433 RepID=UPI00221E898E|nr:uncharacterized protein BZA05DRAFT_407508 [Tricharina praecox]KAI5845963.1 hypothetical protein BZA05DRAFT_407508 [Tricharina praecox]
MSVLSVAMLCYAMLSVAMRYGRYGRSGGGGVQASGGSRHPHVSRDWRLPACLPGWYIPRRPTASRSSGAADRYLPREWVGSRRWVGVYSVGCGMCDLG